MCEQSFLTFITLLFTFLARPKKVNRKKRVQGDSKSPCRSLGLCAFCPYGTKLFREVASQKPRCLAVSLAK